MKSRTVNGMYSYAKLDLNRFKLTLNNDEIGIKPMFLSKSFPDRFLFSSELRSIVKYAGSQIDNTSLVELYLYSNYIGDNTIFKEVEALNGRCLEIDFRHNIDINEHQNGYWKTIGINNKNFLRKRIRDSVRHCLRGNGKFGLALSGGLDSTILAYELNDLGVKNIDTISIITKTTNDGITSLEQLGLPKGGSWETWNHHSVVFHSSDFMQLLYKSMEYFYQPTSMSSLPLYQLLSDKAKELDLRVLILGEGVDEFFFGYESYKKLPSLNSLCMYYEDHDRVEMAKMLFPRDIIEKVIEKFTKKYSLYDYNSFRYTEIELRLRRLLYRTDVILMSNHVEGRTPFLHQGIPSIALNTDYNDLIKESTKDILWEAYADVECINRTRFPKRRFKIEDKLLIETLHKPGLKNLLKLTFAEENKYGVVGITTLYQHLIDGIYWNSDIATLLLTTIIFDDLLNGKCNKNKIVNL